MNSSLIREALVTFISSNCTHTTDVTSTLDEIILNYVVTVLEEEIAHTNDDQFDVKEFSQMLTEYFPSFGDIPEAVVVQWVEGLVQRLGRVEEPKESELVTKFNSVLEILDGGSSRTSSVSEDDDDDDTLCGSVVNETPELLTLCEMFPNQTRPELTSILALANNDIERAVQIILLGGGEEVKRGKKKQPKPEDKTLLKERVVARYGFIDKQEDSKEFRPLLPKEEPKKLVRYREGQVVSTKGERFSEFAIVNGEETKVRTYISKTQRQLQQNH